MGANHDSRLSKLASTLIAISALSACNGDGNAEQGKLAFSDVDTGKVAPEPNFATREKCYGIALAQKNDCAAGKGTNCAGTAEKDYMPEHWQYVAMGECTAKGGSLTEPEDVYKSEK
jgi:uncharacterized membrane protein